MQFSLPISSGEKSSRREVRTSAPGGDKRLGAEADEINTRRGTKRRQRFRPVGEAVTSDPGGDAREESMGSGGSDVAARGGIERHKTRPLQIEEASGEWRPLREWRKLLPGAAVEDKRKLGGSGRCNSKF